MGNKMLEEFHELLDRLDKTGKKFAVWGAGAMGKSALSYINQYNIKLKNEYFVDNNPALWGKNNVISPKDFFDGKMSAISTIFICVYVADEVEDQLRKGGFTGEIMAVLPTVFGQGYRDYYKKWHTDNLDNIENIKKLLADERSIKTIDTFFDVVKTGDVGLWRDVNGNSLDKALEQKILGIGTEERYIDIGAFTGDTVERFLDITGGKYKKIVCFEPEPDNYTVLKPYLEDKENAFAMQTAVSDQNGEAHFNGNMSEGGRLSATGNIVVEIKRLDEVPEAQDATFIKLSTLGHELPGLKGAKNIIRNNKPKLAYYCAGNQMWEIPLFLSSVVPEYKFYIRHYGVGMQAMIGYAVV